MGELSGPEWISAAKAVALVKPVAASAIGAEILLIERAKAGLLRARCLRLTQTDMPDRDNHELDRDFWRQVSPLGMNWTTGMFMVTWLDITRQEKVAHDVEFDRAQVLLIPGVSDLEAPTTRPPPLPEAAPQRSSLSKVPQSELRRWYEAQFAENPDLPFHEVHALASAHFKPRIVSRQPMRNVIGALGHTAKVGNPAIRRK